MNKVGRCAKIMQKFQFSAFQKNPLIAKLLIYAYSKLYGLSWLMVQRTFLEVGIW